MTESKLVLPKTAGRWTRPDSPKFVDADNIFEYMNGAGELYLGFRFHHLESYEYTSNSLKEILVELYYMETSDDAFGLLSLDWGGEPIDLCRFPRGEAQSIESQWPSALYGEGLLRLRSDNIYARIMAYQETPESKQAVLELGCAVAKDRTNPPLPELFKNLPAAFEPGWKLLRDRAGYFRSHLVMNSLYYLSHKNLLNLDLMTEGIAAPYEKDDSSGGRMRFRLLVVKYPGSDRAQLALNSFHGSYLPEHPVPEEPIYSKETGNVFPIEDGWLGYKRQNGILVFIFECPDRETAGDIIDQVKN